MNKCPAKKADGTQCERIVSTSQMYCFAHDPTRAIERRAAASKGGRARHNPELREVKTKLRSLTDDVLNGRIETGRAAVANQLLGTQLRALELERKIREADEIETRLDEIEERGYIA